MIIQTVNPATGELIQSYKAMSDDEVTRIIDLTHQTFLKWRELNFSHRAECMRKMADLLRQRKHDYAKLIAQEMGKPLKQGVAEIEKCALTCDYYADNAEYLLKNKPIKTQMSLSYVTYQPLGIIFAIMPWNFPFWQVFRFAAPTIMAGNTVLLKHAPISTGAALEIEKLFLEAGFLENVFRTLIISDEAAAKVIAHHHVLAVTLTGSPRAGKIVGVEAASALKKTVLELGGSDPYLILSDADLELAAEQCVISRMNNSGQSCIAAKRLIVIDPIKEKFIELVKEQLNKFKFGDPFDPQIQCGPLARRDLRNKVHEQVQASISKGAELILGGKIPSQNGFYYPATLLTNVQKGMPAYQEEIFGPVIAIIGAKDEEEAITIANDTAYGLGAGIFSQDVQRAEKIATKYLQAGFCAINTFVASDPALPFGGIKNSGYGRELSEAGIHSFVNIKTITVR
jgi:succinate-semialdehyde dehydrogenase/glutarate-semialdehyde dehydrogenase